MTSQRLATTFKKIRARKRPGLFPFVTTGYPDVETTLNLIPALEQAGADAIELGVPFTDPMADGPTIQNASFEAIQQGVTLKKCLQVCATLRERGVAIPLILMGYYNPILRYGLKTFALEAETAGVDGVIVADLPPDEAKPLRAVCRPKDIDLISLLAPTSSDKRIARACQESSGFIYCVSLTGITGARNALSTGASEMVQRVRSHTDLPLAVGFGVSSPEHVKAIGKYAEAAVVGSSLIDILDSSPESHRIEYACKFISKLAGRTGSAWEKSK